MAQFKVRYLVMMPGPAGGLPRYFWQPSTKLRAAGWLPQRVPLNWNEFTDAAQLEAAAIARAQELNAELDRVREDKALEATRPPPAPAKRTFGALITHYKQSDEWKLLAPATKRGYQQCIAKLETWAADAPVRAIGALQIKELRKGLAHTPAYANATIRVLRLLLEFGRREEWLTVNPALRPSLAQSEPSGLIWPTAAIPVFVEAADRLGRHSIGTAVMLNEWLGQREADVLRMPRSALRNGKLWVRQNKTGAGVALPVGMVGHLVDRVKEETARVAKVTAQFAEIYRKASKAYVEPMTIVVDEHTGLPWKVDRFRHVFADIRAEAAKAVPNGFEIDYLMPGRDSADPQAFTVRMEDLTFMQLRHTAVTRYGEAQCDTQLISSISGHSLATVMQILERYMVRTSKMASIAFEKRMAAEGLVRPPTQGAGDATGAGNG